MPNPGAWGTGQWGLGPWGGVTTISLVEVYPLGSRSLYARFNTEPLDRSPVSDGDVSNRRTWDLTRDDTGERIEVIGAIRLRLPEERKLILLSNLGPFAVQHTLRGSRLKTSGRLPAAPPTMVTFQGVDVDKPSFGPASRRPRIVDLRNDSFFGEGVALRTDSGGSYATQTGASGLRKRILRIVTTPLGSDPADPSFGCLLALGELIRDPAGQKALVLAQVVRDPEVASATVSLEVKDEGVAYLTVKAKMTDGRQDVATLAVGDAGVSLA